MGARARASLPCKRGASRVERGGTGADPKRSPGHAAGRPRVPPPWGREVAPVGLGAASWGSAQDVGSLSALGALWSWGSHSSRGRSGQGAGVGTQRRLGVLQQKSGGAFWSQSGSKGSSALPAAEMRCGAGLWIETQSFGRDGQCPWVPCRLTFLAFLPPTGAIFVVSRTDGT